MAVNGKRKGAAFERECCKRLSLWLSGGKKQDLLWRSAMSGGRATLSMRAGTVLRRQAGDISAVAPEGHILTSRFFLECKHVKNLSLEGFLLRGTGPLATFWRTAVEEARKYRLQPLLIARQNQMPDLVLTKPRTLAVLAFLQTGMSARVVHPKLPPCEIRLLEEVLTERLRF